MLTLSARAFFPHLELLCKHRFFLVLFVCSDSSLNDNRNSQVNKSICIHLHRHEHCGKYIRKFLLKWQNFHINYSIEAPFVLLSFSLEKSDSIAPEISLRKWLSADRVELFVSWLVDSLGLLVAHTFFSFCSRSENRDEKIRLEWVDKRNYFRNGFTN